jgi:GntR family transcriptional regulator
MAEHSPVPLYFSISAAIEAGIAKNEFPVGAFLPSERELAQRFGVSLITIRAAMAALIDKGLVERQRGKGTVVVARSETTVWELGWLTSLITSVITSKLDLVSMGNVRAPAWVAARMNLSAGGMVHFMRTVRRGVRRSDEPFITTDLYHPLEIGARLRKADFQSQDAQKNLVIDTVERKTGIGVATVRQTMSAEAADRDARKLLGVQIGSPLLVVVRDYFDADGRLVQTGRSRYRTDNYEYVLNLARSAGRRRSRKPNPESLASR